MDTEERAPLVRSYSKDADGEDLSDPSRPSLFTVLGQLGLKLESRKTPADILASIA